MNIYQKYLSRFVIFLSSICIISVLFIESNIGFKWIFHFTNRFFLNLKTEEISGNWRDFTLKNINFDILNMSIKANSVHVVIDIKSLFNIPIIFKEIETKNLKIFFREKQENVIQNNKQIKTLQKNIFFKNTVIFRKIHADKIFVKTEKSHLFLSNVLSGLKLINNNLVIYPTYADSIHIKLSDIKSKKFFKNNKFTKKNNFFKTEKLSDILSFFSHKKWSSIPFNINIKLIKCKKINLINYKYQNFSQVELQINLEKNIFKIKKIKFNFSFLKVQSNGKIIFDKDCSALFLIKNKISIKKLHKKIFHVLLQGAINKKITFNLRTDNLFNINMNGEILLNVLDHPFFINMKSNCLSLPITKDFTLYSENLSVIIQGKIDNYFLSLKNTFSIKGFPSIFFNIQGKGNLKNIFFKKINFFISKENKFNSQINNLKNNFLFDKTILKLIGNVDFLGSIKKKRYNVSIPKIDIHGNFMKKKLSILGSLNYENFHFLNIPGIDFIMGNNKLSLQGSLANQINISSSIHANHLDYFLQNLTGRLKGKANISGYYFSPVFSGHILVKDLNRNDMFIKQINLSTKANISKDFSGTFISNAKKINISNFLIDSLKFKSYWNNSNQNFFLLLKNHGLYIKLILRGKFNNQTGKWSSCFNKIIIKNFLGNWTSRKSILFDDCHINQNKNIMNNRNIKNIFFTKIFHSKIHLFNIFNTSSQNTIKQLSFHTNLKFRLKGNFSNIGILLTGNNITLEKKIEKKIFVENISFLKLVANLKENNFNTTWLVQKSKNVSDKGQISGYLNVIDIYNKKKIKGEFIISNFPCTFISFFITSLKQISGTFDSNIKINKSFYQPKLSANIIFHNLSIISDNLLKYMHIFFHSFLNKMENIKINQEIKMKKVNLFFTLSSVFLQNHDSVQWNLSFNSKKIIFLIFYNIKLKLSSHLSLHYFLSKYDLMGYIKSSLFYFNINEKNFEI